MEEKKDLAGQGSSFKKFICVTAAAVFLFLLGIMALVVYVDPFFHYHAPLENFPYLVDNQLSQNPGMAKLSWVLP